MGARCLLYYITDRTQLPGSEAARRGALLDKIGEAAHAGVDFVQLREKDLSTRELECLTRDAVHVVREARTASGRQEGATRLLINSRTDVALAAGADGVHLRSDDVRVSAVQSIWKRAFVGGVRVAERPVVAVSCHSFDDVRIAESEGADFAVFAPVFGKKAAPEARSQGVAALREVCGAGIPVLALGGITIENATLCLAAGAAGIAGIRLFQENRIGEVVRALGEVRS